MGRSDSNPYKPLFQRRFGSKERRILFLIVGGLIALLVVIGAGVYWVKQEGQRHYNAGSALNEFFVGLGSAMKAEDLAKVTAHYAGTFLKESSDQWGPKLIYDVEGLGIEEWALKPEQHPGKRAIEGYYRDLFRRSERIGFAKFKIESLEFESRSSAKLNLLSWYKGLRSGKSFETKILFDVKVAKHLTSGWEIQDQRLIHGKTVYGDRSGFTEETDAWGIDFVSHTNPMWQMADWKPKKFEIIQYAHGGIAAADYDNDGWYDLFFSDAKHPRLYRNTGEGRFQDVTIEAGLPETLVGVHASLFVDLDNDGDKDLFVGRSTGENRLFRNNGDGSFSDVTEGAGLGGFWSTTMAAADYDNDGLLDLYVARYLDPRVNLPTTPFYTRNSEGNSLYRNLGGLRFEDVTETAGVREGGLSLGVTWADFNQDENIDLYVANDFGRNAYFANRGDGRFDEIAADNGTVDVSYGMSAAAGDVNNDGRLDLMISNIHSGQRWFGNEATLKNYLVTVTQEGVIGKNAHLYKELYDVFAGDITRLGDRVWRGNTLFLNQEDTQFADISERSQVNPHGWYWGGVQLDYDGDGWLDAYHVNGWITGHEKDDL